MKIKTVTHSITNEARRGESDAKVNKELDAGARIIDIHVYHSSRGYAYRVVTFAYDVTLCGNCERNEPLGSDYLCRECREGPSV